MEALSLHIEGMMEDGEAIPEPSTLDELGGDPAVKGAVAFLVGIDVTEKAERFNITARRSQMRAIDRMASDAGMTRSAYMVVASLNGKRVARERRT